MADNWSFVWHERERVLESSLRGKWSRDDVDGYYAALDEQVGRHGQGTPLALLCDLTEYKVQDPEIAERQQQMIAGRRERGGISRTAWVVAGAVATMQHRRTREASRTPVFFANDRETAWSWITRTPAGVGQSQG